jgi:hypothetical protein
MSKRIPELPLATQLNTEDQFIFYSNSDKETQRINAGISLNVIANNLPSVLKATTNAALGIANAAVAQAAASAAQADATTAIGDAAGAQASADGKNKIFYQTTAPTNPISGYTLKENDLWFDIDGGYRMAKWDGTQWVDYGLESEAIANLDAGKITAGFISSQAIELANSDAFLQSSSYIQTWVSGMQCSVYNGSAANYGKLTPSHNVRCKVKQADGTYKVFNCLNVAGSTNAPAASGNNTWWAEIAVPTVAVDVDGDSVNIPNFGFRVVGQGTAEFSAATFTGNIQSNTGFFGSGKNIVKIGSSGLTIGNSGYIKSDGITYAATAFSGNGFFLGNTQGEGQENAYQFYIGNAATSKFLRWDGTNLVINGRIATGSVLGESGSGSSVNSQGGIVVGSTIGIRRNVDNNVLSITGGTDNWGAAGENNGAGQIDLVGKNTTGGIAGVVQLIGGKVSTGNILLRTWSGTENNYNNCLTASRNGSVGINDLDPSSSNGIKLDVYGSMRIREGVVYATNASYSGYTVALNDGTNNVRFQYNSSVGLYAKINTDDPVLIVSPKLNLSAAKILAPFTFDQAGGVAGGLKAGTITWDSSGTLTGGSGVAITAYGIVGAKSGSPKFTINIDGDATFAGALSAPTGNFGGWTIGNTNISGGNITIDSSTNNGYIATGQTGYNTGTGFWVGSVSGTAKLSVGNSAGNYLTWDGSSLSIKGSITLVNTIPSGSVSGLGALATQNSVAYGDITGTKPPSNADVTLNAINGSLTLTGGGLVLASGGASIRGGQTAYNTGTGFWLGDVSGTTKFSLGNPSGNYIAWDGSSLSIKGTISLVNTIPNTSVSGLGSLSTQNSVAYGDITGTKPPSNADVTLNAIQGSLTLTGGGLVLASGGASLRGGQTDYNTGNGFWIGDVGGTSKFSIGNPSGNYVTWDGSTLSVGGTISSASTIGGRSGTDIASAINSGGVISNSGLNNKLNVSTGVILTSFSFEGSNYAGALKAGDITWNTSGAITGGSGIVINAKGIIGAAAGVPTFSIDSTTGAAIFKGDITGASGTFSGTLSATVGTIGGLTIAASRLHSGTKTALNDTVNGFYLGTDGVSIRSSAGAAALEIVSSRGRFTTRNTANEITGAFQGEDGATGGSFLFLANSTGVDTISFFGQSGFSYFSTFYDKNDTNYYCNPAETSVFNGLDVGGYAVLTTNSGALTAGASTNFGQLQVNDWLTFDNSQTRLSISDDFGSGNYLTYAGGNSGHRWVNSGNSVQLADLDNSGNLSASSHPTYSSRRFKQNIRPIENALDTLKQLNGKIFDWKTKNVTNDIGFIAEEVNEVLPTLVNFDQDGQTKSLDYSRITALLTEAVKEQSETISSLVAVIAGLESRLNKLETN